MEFGAMVYQLLTSLKWYKNDNPFLIEPGYVKKKLPNLCKMLYKLHLGRIQTF